VSQGTDMHLEFSDQWEFRCWPRVVDTHKGWIWHIFIYFCFDRRTLSHSRTIL